MSIKHGAILGLALTAIVMLGFFGTGAISAKAAVPVPPEGFSGSLAAREAKPLPLPSEGSFISLLPGPGESSAPLPLLASSAGFVPEGEAEAENEVVFYDGKAAETCDDLFLDFEVTSATRWPVRAMPGATFSFYPAVIDNTTGGYADIDVVQWFFTNPISLVAPFTADNQVLIQNPNFPESSTVEVEYPDEGVFNVGMRVRLTNGVWCPPLDSPPFIHPQKEVIIADIAAANFEATDMMGDFDGQALLPLNDWIPLFAFTMTYDDFAPRTLTQLLFRLRRDPLWGDRPYFASGQNPRPDNFLEFGLFRDFGDDGPDQVLELNRDPLFLTWDPKGYPYEMPVNVAPDGSFVYQPNDLVYNLNFTFDPRDVPCNPAYDPDNVNPLDPTDRPCFRVNDLYSGLNPKFPFEEWVTSGPDPFNGYIVAVRLSSSWESGQTLSYELLNARMQIYYGAGAEVGDDLPRDDSGALVDSYSPDFYEGDILSEDVGFSSSFEVWDIRGSDQAPAWANQNLWNWEQRIYTPGAEYVRPRWDLPSATIQAVSAEILDLRKVFAVEAWVPLLGINAHGACTGQLREVNVIFTDIGADPFGPPGNGGFDPREGLNRFTNLRNADYSVGRGRDYAFNGLWVWYDTGTGDTCNFPTANCEADGIFNPPTPLGTNGVALNDYPMIPEFAPELGTALPQPTGLHEWEYIPFPPGGGDPWWKIRLRLSGGRRRASSDVCLGTLEPVPDVYPGTSIPQPDFFVVMRADSGFTDMSGATGDGVGLFPGADMRCFIEPRRWNPGRPSLYGRDPVPGHWDGGIAFSNQVLSSRLPYPELADNPLIDPATIGFWQNDPRLDTICPEEDYPCPEVPSEVFPWWHERMHNRDNVKPVRSNIEVHDLVMTYSSDSLYSKVTPIMVGQDLGRFTLGLVEQSVIPRGSGFPLWMDPAIFPLETPIDFTGDGIPDNLYGILEARFFAAQNPDINSDTFGSNQLINTQYAFETVPFRLSGDAVDATKLYPRSRYFRNPFEQPTLPRYHTWPIWSYPPVNYGFLSYCYLHDDMGDNEPFHDPTTSTSEETYKNDVYAFELMDPQLGGLGDVSGMWLVDAHGAKFYIESNSGTTLYLREGHGAYLDKFMVSGDPLDLPDHPFGVPVGEEFAVWRGRWMVVEDTLVRGTYPRMSDWPAGMGNPDGSPGPDGESRAARLLKQKINAESAPTAMLGINLVGIDDNAVAQYNPTYLKSITVAFWGPEFDPSHLAKLDMTAGPLSGVALYEDTNGTGVFEGPLVFSGGGITLQVGGGDAIVPLDAKSLQWSASGPEAIDLYGDFQPDDLSGDGLVVLRPGDEALLTPEELDRWDGLYDAAWVLRLVPAIQWTVPRLDVAEEGTSKALNLGYELKDNFNDWPDYWMKTPRLIEVVEESLQKQVTISGNQGDDLFVVVRSSDTIPAFSQFRCVIPARLPERHPASEVIAGIEMPPMAYPQVGSFMKSNPEESAVQDFYGHDMLEAAVGTKIVDLTESLFPPVGPQIPLIEPGGPAAAMLGLDLSANRPENLIAEGTAGNAAGVTFRPNDIVLRNPRHFYSSVSPVGWTADVSGLWLVGMTAGEAQDSRVAAWEITSTDGTALTLRGGIPRDGSPWMLVKDPTFLEQVIVEFYDINADGQFDLQKDLLPLNFEDPANGQISGVALYRDNDWHPNNTPGVFDPPIYDSDGNFVEYVDLPLNLDYPPILIGALAGDPQYQVKFVFSSPGTDHYRGLNAAPYETQPNLRQVIPQSFGRSISDPEFGPDFFVVVRSSRDMNAGDDFAVGIVSWGPNTPSEPDPDNFDASIQSTDRPGQRPTEFNMFSEFPWGSRALGFITFFQDPPPVYYWGYDKLERRQVPRAEVDHSQDDRDIRYWVRSRAAKSSVTRPITALPSPEVDFVGVPRRQVPNQPVQFTLQTTGTVSRVLWNFGDGATSTERNPSHSYAKPGFYTVSVTVTDRYGIDDTVTKINYIEILNAPFADFEGTPLIGVITPGPPGSGLPPGLDVRFWDLSIGTPEIVPQSYFWNFGDGQTQTTPVRATEDNPLIHRYTAPGFYTVTLQVTFYDSINDRVVTDSQTRTNYITVIGGVEGEGEGEVEDPNPADFSVQTLIRDQEALVPLHDWVPLFQFSMGYPADTPAPRVLSRLVYRIRGDSRSSTDLGYGNLGGPDVTDLLEFGLFYETASSDDADNKQLDWVHDGLMFTWDNTGFPVASLQDGGNSLIYTLDLIGDGTAINPEYPVPTRPNADDGLDGASYIVAVRTSATWRSMLTLACDVLDAEMLIPQSGAFPRNEEGEAIDSYSPNFYDNEILEEEAAYSSSFTAWDITGTPAGYDLPLFHDAWNYPAYLYTPLAEYTRPRWSRTDRLLDFMTGEILEIRNLISLDTWRALIGINLHATSPVHYFENEPTSNLGLSEQPLKGTPQLREVNVVMTDIGGDPFGAPGNGGFNPVTGLKRMTEKVWGAPINPNEVLADDFTYNGIWVWHDTNNNGVFDPPTMNPEGGISWNGDYPLFPESFFWFTDPPRSSDWEYVPFPPGGGDPWWKISMRFYGGHRRSAGELADAGNTAGHLEKVPDNHRTASSLGSDYSSDFFVVIRTDSGFQDVSLGPADGNGIAMGADFRAFIEPRRFDPDTGSHVGGIYTDAMIPTLGIKIAGDLTWSWQDDWRWGYDEPWWPQRTVNAASTKPSVVGVEVHDLVLTYQSDSQYRLLTDILDYTDAPCCFGYSDIGIGLLSDFDMWMDPFGLRQGQFLNGHTVGVSRWRLFVRFTYDFGPQTISAVLDDTGSRGHFAYETVPFDHALPGQPDPRSSAFPEPPALPTIPEYDTWTGTLAPGEYPRASQWAAADAQARLLTQKVDNDGLPTAMLGINLVGSNDPVANATNEMNIAQIVVAFWGPDFKPSDLAPLDPNGLDVKSGVLLWEDADQNGVFLSGVGIEHYADSPVTFSGFDQPVPLRNLQWRTQPEFIDLDGNGLPDDMNGDGVIDDRDKAWVLTITPQELWPLPHEDAYEFEFEIIDEAKSDTSGMDASPVLTVSQPEKSASEKALDVNVSQPGDDLFITVRTSDTVRRFQQIRAVIPATLPGRTENQRKAGIQFYPQVNTSPSAYKKSSPEEDAVQDFYGHDMLESNVPVRIVDMAGPPSVLRVGGSALPVLGLDLATNRVNATLAKGASGSGSDGAFTVAGEAWTPNAFAGDWLVDEAYESYEIVGNTATMLTLLSGTPRNGPWRIVRDPSFLEQVIVELYNEGTVQNFNPLTDLLPLDIDQELSGVAIYRDNDHHPNNRNGFFDPGIDIPLTLDAAPRYVGLTGEDTQVKFVFSSPGTDDYPLPRAQQPRNRQWIPDSFGATTGDPDSGPDFFIVVRASEDMREYDNFRMGIVSWGPNTPTEPDPDTWARLTTEDRNEFSKFQEFPWGSRGLGFITFFKDPLVRYSMDGYTAKRKTDNSGFDWIRSHSAKKRRSSVVEARNRAISPTSVVISGASQTRLPSQTLPGQPFNFVIRGSGFGTQPEVHMSGYDVTVIGSTGTDITVSISTIPDYPPQEPIVLIVRNPVVQEEASRTNLFTLSSDPAADTPKVTGVQPSRGEQKDFPVVVTGRDFAARGSVDVLFGRTFMPIIDVSADGTSITVGFPVGGLPATGKLDVTVRNREKSREDVLVGGFEYLGSVQRNQKTFSVFGCAPGAGDPSRSSLAWDAVLMILVTMSLFAAARWGRLRGSKKD